MFKWVKKLYISLKLRQQEEYVLKVLNKYANYYCLKNFGIPFQRLVMFSDERDLIGKFSSYMDIPLYIMIGREFYYNTDVYDLFDCLHHELVHYSLCVLELPYNDDDDCFQLTCEVLNVPTEYVRGRYYENKDDTIN